MEPNRHILIVNEDRVVTMVTKQVLERHGYRVTTAEYGLAALAALDAGPPDLMLLDIQMPGMDGVQVARLMEKPVPFLIQSTLPDDDERVVTLMECGALGRVSTKTLLADVEQALSR